MSTGSLTVVGTGIQPYTQLTDGGRAALREAEIVFYASSNPLTDRMLRELNPNLVSLHDLYGKETHRLKTYKRMADRIMGAVRAGKRTCAAYYGHAGVFAMTPHAVVRMARDEGFEAEMLPGVSAEDCLIADLGIDPGAHGLQSYEATNFLLRRVKPDVSSALVLWQIAFIGTSTAPGETIRRENLQVLSEVLAGFYGPAHPVTVYEASSLPGFQPVCATVAICELPLAEMSSISTLYVPPLPARRVDRAMEERLGMTAQDAPGCLH
jgi:hypothetical protein